MSKILIYGAPGAGKSSTTMRLGDALAIPTFEGDYLREHVAQSEKTEAEDPFLYVGTKEAWRHFGEFKPENVIKGLHAVRNSMLPYVDAEIAKHENIIFEVAFLTPQAYNGKLPLILVVTRDEAKHRQQFFSKRPESHISEQGFAASRILQEFLINEAASLKVTIVENDSSLDETAKKIADLIAQL